MEQKNDRNCTRRFLSIILSICVCLLLVPSGSSAASEKTGRENSGCRITIRYEISDAEFALYKVASITKKQTAVTESQTAAAEGLCILPEPAFADCDLDWKQLRQQEGIADISEKLAVKVDKNGILPLKTGTTDQNGTLIFQNLDPGLYLLQGKDTVKGNKCYRTTPSLLTISGSISEDVWTDKEELEVKPKCEITEETETEKETEASVGTETPAETPPTYPDDPGSRLPNTGRLLWPIPILSAAGLLLFVIGWKKRNRSKN